MPGASNLFVDKVGNPMVFYVSPIIRTRKSIVEAVKKGGGVVTKTSRDQGTVEIIEDSKSGAYLNNARVVSDKFIFDSVKQKKLAQIAQYSAAARHAALNASPDARGRQAYTLDEDYKIYSYAIRHQQQGASIWKAAEREGVTSHPWQSMHNRFKRRLAHSKNVELESITREVLDSAEQPAGTLLKGMYTTRDDESIDDIARLLNIDRTTLLEVNQVYYEGITLGAKFYEGSQIVLPLYCDKPLAVPKEAAAAAAAAAAASSAAASTAASGGAADAKASSAPNDKVDTDADDGGSGGGGGGGGGDGGGGNDSGGDAAEPAQPVASAAGGPAKRTRAAVAAAVTPAAAAVAASSVPAPAPTGGAKKRTRTSAAAAAASPSAAPAAGGANGNAEVEKVLKQVMTLSRQPRAVAIFALHAFSGQVDPASIYLQGLDGTADEIDKRLRFLLGTDTE